MVPPLPVSMLWKNKADRLLSARAVIASLAPASTTTLIRLASIRNNPYTFVVAGPRGRR